MALTNGEFSQDSTFNFSSIVFLWLKFCLESKKNLEFFHRSPFSGVEIQVSGETADKTRRMRITGHVLMRRTTNHFHFLAKAHSISQFLATVRYIFISQGLLHRFPQFFDPNENLPNTTP